MVLSESNINTLYELEHYLADYILTKVYLTFRECCEKVGMDIKP